jgi:hypothetical protein
LSEIANDSSAKLCELQLIPTDDKKRFNLAFYWLTKIKKTNDALVQSDSDGYLNRSMKLLEEAAARNFIPAVNLLAGIHSSQYYGLYDLQKMIKWLNKGRLLNDSKSIILLAIYNYTALSDTSSGVNASFSFDSIDEGALQFNANQRYVLATAYMLGLKDTSENNIEKAKSLYRDNAELADLDYVNQAAWYFAVSDKDFDATLALDLAYQFKEAYRNTTDWEQLDTLSAAYAAKNNFEKAIEYADKAKTALKADIFAYENGKVKHFLTDIETKIMRYKKNKRIREPLERQELANIFLKYTKEIMRVDISEIRK